MQSRWVPALGLSVLTSLAMFWLLFGLIRAGEHAAADAQTLVTIDFVRLKRDSEVETLQRRKPPPPPPEQPPPPAKMKVAADTVQQQAPMPFAMPNLSLSANVGGGPFVGEMGGGATAASLFDGDIIPLQRIAPQYPREAARARIGGWVQLEVMVNADGSVRSARVLDAKPKGLFDAAAVTAVLRWKFKPKVVDGQPVPQRGSQRIEFNLTNG